MTNNKYRSIVKLDFQYAHRFMNYPGEASYLHGHSGLLTIEIEGDLDNHNYAYPVKEAQKLVWAVADNFHHATIFQEGDPLIDLVLQGYEKTGMKGTTHRYGAPQFSIRVTRRGLGCKRIPTAQPDFQSGHCKHPCNIFIKKILFYLHHAFPKFPTLEKLIFKLNK